MISVASVESVVTMLLLVLAYSISVMLSGSAHALVARSCGDSSAEQEGFLSGNPSYFFDFFGFICLLLFGFGWGRRPPFYPFLVSGPHKAIKVFCVYITEAAASLGIAMVSLVFAIAASGKVALYIITSYSVVYDLLRRISFHDLARCMPHQSSLLLLVSMFGIILTSLNILLALWSLINNSVRYGLYLGSEYNYAYMRHEERITWLGPLILFIVIAPPLYLFLLYAVCAASVLISSAIGLL